MTGRLVCGMRLEIAAELKSFLPKSGNNCPVKIVSRDAFDLRGARLSALVYDISCGHQAPVQRSVDFV
jgi:hypothetical protein